MFPRGWSAWGTGDGGAGSSFSSQRPTCGQQRYLAGTSQLWVPASETSRWGSRKGRQVLKGEARRLCLDLLYHFRDCIHSFRLKITASDGPL